MPSFAAAARAFSRSRDAIAVTVDDSPRCMAGMTFSVAIFATPSTPHRILRIAGDSMSNSREGRGNGFGAARGRRQRLGSHGRGRRQRVQHEGTKSNGDARRGPVVSSRRNCLRAERSGSVTAYRASPFDFGPSCEPVTLRLPPKTSLPANSKSRYGHKPVCRVVCDVMSRPITRREALKQLTSATTGVALSGGIIRGQTADITIGGQARRDRGVVAQSGCGPHQRPSNCRRGAGGGSRRWRARAA